MGLSHRSNRGVAGERYLRVLRWYLSGTSQLSTILLIFPMCTRLHTVYTVLTRATSYLVIEVLSFAASTVNCLFAIWAVSIEIGKLLLLFGPRV